MSTPTPPPAAGTGQPVPPIALAGGHDDVDVQLDTVRVPVPEPVLDRLRKTGAEVITEGAEVVEASRDWWPGAMVWATEGRVPGLAGAVVRPSTPEQVADVLRLCNAARVPVTAAGGRSGVCGASVPVFGGVVLDTTALTGIHDIDHHSMVVTVAPGTFGDQFEASLRELGFTCGHWPQSIALATVGEELV